MLTDDSNRNGIEFVNTELDLSKVFAERVASFSAGHMEKAKQSASAAKTAYRAIQKFLPRLGVQGEERESIAVKLENLNSLIEKLFSIK